MTYRLLLTCCALLLAVLPCRAQNAHNTVRTPPLAASSDAATNAVRAFAPNVKPSLSIPHLGEAPIKLDGLIDDAGWNVAARATNFSETFPGDQTRPPIDVTVYMTYDDTHVYFGFDIRDDPASIRATMTDRDRIWQDDYSGILLDTNGDGQQVYFIAANPLGIQGDTRISRGNEDVSFDLVFDANGQITDTGYQIEMAVPFRSLRFPRQDVQNWKATFWITHPRESRSTYSWAAIDRDDPCFSCQFGDLSGMRGVTSGKNLEILPAITGSHSGSLVDAGDPDSGFDNNRVGAEPSFNLKYGITSDLTLDASVNPDFSQIEADVAQIDVNSSFALFFPERRPFFQEGSELFRTYISTVYTRSINNPIAATKLTGRFGQTSVGYIGARDNDSPILVPFEENSELAAGGKSFSNILRVQHNFVDNSYIGGLATDRRLEDGGAGTTVGLDGVWRFLTKYEIQAQVVGSHTEEPNNPALSEDFDQETFADGKYTAAFDGETFSGYATYLSFVRNARHWNYYVDFTQTSPTFRASNGFVTQNDNRFLLTSQSYTFYPENIGFIDRIQPGVTLGKIWNYDGLRKDEFISPRLFLSLKAQTNVNLNYILVSNERFAGTDFRGIWRVMLNVNSNFSEPVKLGAFFSKGRAINRDPDDAVLGYNLDLQAWGTIRPTQRLVLEPQITYAQLEHPDTGDLIFSGYIARTRLNYQFTKRFFTRLVVQYNDFSDRLEIDPLFTYRINPFSAFHVGSTHDFNSYARLGTPQETYYRQSERQVFFKFQYLLRV